MKVDSSRVATLTVKEYSYGANVLDNDLTGKFLYLLEV